MDTLGAHPVPAPAVPGMPAIGGRLLGVDPGTRVVGYAIIDVPAPGRFEYIECGVLRVRARDDLHARLLELGTGLREVITEFRPAALAIERAFHGLNAASALKLAEARGALKLVALEHGLPVSEYAPARIKRAVVGNGRATKAEVQARVRLLCRLSNMPESDAADALAIAICHVQASRLPNVDPEPRAQLRRQLARKRKQGRR
ncbi:Crossover junction endodeoxyribonuclease RuvC [Enhygromyxa salina]|uniref:Crossover junction endodeoxyribonuclease RuvC n=1 Tax=Enhygromyxa salina TaxID=215803 RepID=A0A0C1ZPH9_9BACT|nr:crossover junction endodeoxyribonuclease RuvC [Enhygromyxa salina]KIG12928.1 Crossover junction endodeoxyribonuclease RuvC [Enhygromyxa salina]